MIPAWLYTTRWLVLDVETTGLDPAADRILQLAAIQVDPGPVFGDAIVSVVNPGIGIPPEATAIHGIDRAATAAAPSFADLVPRLIEVSRGRAVLGYNAAFDMTFIRAELSRAGHKVTGAGQVADPLVWIKEFDRWEKGPGRHKLGATCRRWGVKLEAAHDARADAIAAWDLWVAMVERMHHRFPEDFAAMLGQQGRMARDQEADFQDWKRRNPKKETAA